MFPETNHPSRSSSSTISFCHQADHYNTGHERSLNQIIFNAEGDLLFSASKDPVINVWYTSNGERLGTFGGRPGEGGHKGCVWSVACDCELISHSQLYPILYEAIDGDGRVDQTRYMVSGGADNTMKLWEISSGKLLKSWEFLTAVKRVAWRYEFPSRRAENIR